MSAVAGARRHLDRLRYRRLLRRMAGPRLIRAFAQARPEAVFVEIGANDGDEHDHLREVIHAGAWRGLMVEPVPYVFERLQRNYGALERVTLVNVAVADEDGRRPFYHLAAAGPGDAGLTSWYDQIGSFSRDAVLGHARHIPDIEERLVEREVECLTFASLCRRHALDHVDLVLVDTEGYDHEIVGHLDLEDPGLRPRLLVFEHFHLAEDDRDALRAKLRASGFALLEEGFDTFCLDTRIDDELTRRFRRLEPAVPAVTVRDEQR